MRPPTTKCSPHALDSLAFSTAPPKAWNSLPADPRAGHYSDEIELALAIINFYNHTAFVTPVSVPLRFIIFNFLHY